MQALAEIAPSLGSWGKLRPKLAADGAIPLTRHRTLRNLGRRRHRREVHKRPARVEHHFVARRLP